MEIMKVLVVFALSLVLPATSHGQEKNKPSFRVRIYVGGYGVFETTIANDERLAITREDLIRNGKKVSLFGELADAGFREQSRIESKNARWSRQLREIQMLAMNCGGRYSRDGYEGVAYSSDYQYSKKAKVLISEESITDVSVRDESGNMLFCGYLGSEVSEFQIVNNRLIFVRAGSELASFTSIPECAKALNAELDGTTTEPTLKFLADGVSEAQFGYLGSMVVLSDEENESCWWLAECNFRSYVTHHLLRMNPKKRNVENKK